MRKLSALAAVVVVVGGVGWFGWTKHLAQQESDVAASYARKSVALVTQQMDMVKPGSGATVGDYFSTSKSATEALDASIVELDSREWIYRPDDKEASRALSASARDFIRVIAADSRMRLERAAAKKRSEEASAAIAKSKNTYEIDALSVQMNAAFDEQVRSLENEISSIKPNREKVQALLRDNARAVALLGVVGLDEDAKASMNKMYPED
ncbi:hypothetical protein ACTUVN_004470 [Pseudomonas caspiana]